MKKHFLILMLMAFLPMVGWAQAQSLSGYKVEMTYQTAKYTGESLADAAEIKLTKEGADDITTGFTVNWSPSEPINVRSQGYTVTVEGDMSNTFGSPTQTTDVFYVLKADNGFKDVNNVANPPTAAANKTYAELAGADYPLLSNTTAPEALFGTVEYKINDGEWGTEFPKASKVGSYTIHYRVQGAANYVGINENDAPGAVLGPVVISGSDPTASGYTAPAAPEENLTFTWDNTTNAAKDQILLKEGTGVIDATKGTLLYKVDDATVYTEGAPKASAAGTHTVYWKIQGAAGYADVAGGNFEVTIDRIQPTTITPATANTGLTYTYDKEAAAAKQQQLITAGSATDGATSKLKYKFRYKSMAANAEWTGYSATALALDDVKAAAAGTYEIKTLVETEGNYLEKEAESTTTVTIAQAAAFTTAPSAKTVEWNNKAQELIDYSGVTAPVGIVQYSKNGTSWSGDPTTIKETAAGEYSVYFKVEDLNYVAAASSTETPLKAKINKRALSVRVNSIAKTYNGSGDFTGDKKGNAAIINGLPKFTFMNRLSGDYNDETNFDDIAYVALTAAEKAAYKNADTYSKVVTVTLDNLKTLNPNYEYTILPGDLIISKAPLTVTANDGLTTVQGTALDISKSYEITGYVNNEKEDDVFATSPVLTSNAGTNPNVGTYTLSFTEGTLNTPENYAVTYVTEGKSFIVTEDNNRKLVITILPHALQYGATEDWSNMKQGEDFEVSNLVTGDALKVDHLVFKRSDATNFNVGPYDLTTATDLAIGDVVANPSKYPGGLVVNPSTFNIVKRVLTAKINQQTVVKGATNADIDKDAWTVEGLQNGEEKSILAATLAINGTAAGTTGLKDNGLVLTINAANSNYTFETEAGVATNVAYGKLLVIDTETFALTPNDANLEAAIETADGEEYNVTFADKTMQIGEWYAMVLPFDVDPLKMVSAFGRYVIFNELNVAGTDDQNFKFTLTLNPIPAGTPFLIKFAPKTGDAADAVVNWAAFNSGTYGAVTIKKGINDVETDYVVFTGTYTSKELQGLKDGNGEKVWWLADSKYKNGAGWKKPKTNKHTALPMEAYLNAEGKAWTTYAPNITVEDFDGQTTAIKTISVNSINDLKTDGLYNLQGVKMQGTPAKNGIYIQNGKKILVK